MKTNTPFNIIFLKIIYSTFKRQTNSSVLKLNCLYKIKNPSLVFSLYKKNAVILKLIDYKKLNYQENSLWQF